MLDPVRGEDSRLLFAAALTVATLRLHSSTGQWAKWPDSFNDEHHDVIYVTETPSSVTYPKIAEVVMACELCAANQAEFSSEICIHFPGRKNLDKPAVLVFSEISVCLNCGSARFTVQQTELLLLRESQGEVPKTA